MFDLCWTFSSMTWARSFAQAHGRRINIFASRTLQCVQLTRSIFFTFGCDSCSQVNVPATKLLVVFHAAQYFGDFWLFLFKDCSLFASHC